MIEDVEMEISGEYQEARRPRRSVKRRPPSDYGESRRYREPHHNAYGLREMESPKMAELGVKIEQSQKYAQRQKTKKSTIKRQALIMAEALGRSERNVETLVSYIRKVNHQRM